MGSCPQNPGWKQAWPPRARRVGCGVLGRPQRSSRNRLAELLGRGGWSGWGGVPVDSLTGLTEYVPRRGAQAPLTPQPRNPPAIWRLRCGCRTPAGLMLLRRARRGCSRRPLSAPRPRTAGRGPSRVAPEDSGAHGPRAPTLPSPRHACSDRTHPPHRALQLKPPGLRSLWNVPR